MARSKQRHTCVRSPSGKTRSITAIRNQAQRLGLKSSGSKAQICNRITAKQRRSKSRSRTRRSRSRRSRSRSRALLGPNCKQYLSKDNCFVDPNCNWIGGKLNRCQARKGVRAGRLYSGPIQQILAQREDSNEINCKQYTSQDECYKSPNCDWRGGLLQRCQRKKGVLAGDVYQGPMGMPAGYVAPSSVVAPVASSVVSPTVAKMAPPPSVGPPPLESVKRVSWRDRQKNNLTERLQNRKKELDEVAAMKRVSTSPLRQRSPVKKESSPGLFGLGIAGL